jgi:signal transduction histidine kinase
VDVVIRRRRQEDMDFIRMLIADNGIGFRAARSKRNFGLQTMHERAESVHGRLGIESTRGQGTTIECLLPCLQEERLPRQSVVIHG